MTVVAKHYNGMNFYDLLVSSLPVKTEVAVSRTEKIVVERMLTLQQHREAYKHKPEFLLSSWSFDYPVFESRGVSASPYWRSEQILCEVADFKKLRAWRDFFFDAFNILDCALKGIDVTKGSVPV